jgi:long-chain acyl-CoA synthetase
MTSPTTLSTVAEVDASSVGRTVPRDFLELVRAHPTSPALHSMRSDGGWNSWTMQQFADQVAAATAGLQAAGVGAHERVLLMMRNRPDFHWFDAAAQFLRATPVSIYNSSSPEEIQYLAGHAEARVAIVENSGFLDRILKVRAELPALERIYVIEPPEGPLPNGVYPVSELFSAATADLDALAALTEPDDVATLIYTSGTTGPPKGVMITQYNVVYTIEMAESIGGRTGPVTIQVPRSQELRHGRHSHARAEAARVPTSSTRLAARGHCTRDRLHRTDGRSHGSRRPLHDRDS